MNPFREAAFEGSRTPAQNSATHTIAGGTLNQSFIVADVFTNSRFSGAQVAVFPDAQDLSAQQRQDVTDELNLWATVFIEASGERQFRTHTYTPVGEASFGSHTAVAAATALADQGKILLDAADPFVFESKEGQMDVYVERDNDGTIRTRLSQSITPHIDIYVPLRNELADILGVSESMLRALPFRPLFSNVDHNYLIVPATSYEAVREAVFNPHVWRSSSAASMAAYEILLFSTGSRNSPAEFHARLLGPHIGYQEDPPVGAAVPAFVAYLCNHEHVRTGTQRFTIERGVPTARVSMIEVEMDNRSLDQITLRVGGCAVISTRGEISLAG